MASLGEGFLPSRSSSRRDRDTSYTLSADIRPSASTEPVIFRSSFSLCELSIVLVLATIFPCAISADANFTLESSSYNCDSNLICLGHAHVYPGSNSSRIQDPRLSLIWERNNAYGFRSNVGAGIAYYKEPVRLKDPFTNQSASFSTSFSMDVVMVSFPRHGNGMAFVISADNKTLGEERVCLGIFDGMGITTFKSIVVEFDLYQDRGRFPLTYDISDNHVSFDFSNITTTVAANASNVGVELWNNITTYAWVDYRDEAHQLEVRVSNSNSRPSSPLLQHTLDLSEVVEEYMWVGFSAGSGDYYSNYYIGEWSFQSFGISPFSSPARTRPSSAVGSAVVVPALVLACIVIIGVGVYRIWSGGRGGLTAWSGGRGALATWTGGRRGYLTLPLDPRIKVEQVHEFGYHQLIEATNGFSEENKIGGGGFGAVYRGMLSNTQVAVKVVSSDSAQGEKEFMAEVSIISQASHPNVIKLIGCCKARRNDASLTEKYLLVYELMSNGSLDKRLFPVQELATLSWPQRLNIVMKTAAAINYLHQGWNGAQVIHRDIKSSNIMLDEALDPKLGDFGLALLVDHHREASTTILAGTRGYLAPELYILLWKGLNSGRFTVKTDVYAFGVVVLEVVCGRGPLLRSDGSESPPHDMLLVDWVWRHFSKDDLLSTVDKRLNNELNNEDESCGIDKLLRLGLACCHTDPVARPAMQQVVQILSGDPEAPWDFLANIPTSKPVPAFNVFSSDCLSPGLIDEPSNSVSRTLTGEPSQSLELETGKNSGARHRSFF